MIEEHALSKETADRFQEAIPSTIASMQTVNGYFVKQTKTLDETLRYLSRMTALLKSMYEAKPLHVVPSIVLSSTTYLDFIKYLRTEPSLNRKAYNITMPTFDSLASKSDMLTLRDVYLKMLMCTRGITGDKALAIQKVWSTPKALIDAYEQCEDDKGRDNLLEGSLGKLVGRGAVKGTLSAKVADIWAR